MGVAPTEAAVDISGLLGVGDLEALLVCPACQFVCVHPSRVVVDRGGDLVDVDQFGVGFATRPSTARGVIVTLEFFCEEGHRFALGFRFHKGITCVHSVLCPDVPCSPDESPQWPGTIWRD